TETLVAALRGTPYDTGLDLPQFAPIADHFRTVRRKYHQFESDFNGVDAEILSSQIPGGMLSNLAAQLAEQNALDKMKQVLEGVRKELEGKITTIEDQLSCALFPAAAREFFEERERGELKPEQLEPPPEKGPAVAHELHLAPVEFNITLHGESYHIRVSGAGRKSDGRKPYYIRVNEKLEEVSLEPIQEVLAGVPEQPEAGRTTGANRLKPTKPGDVASPMPGRVVKVLVSKEQTVNL